MTKFTFVSFLDYIISRGIKKVERVESYNKSVISEKDIIAHLKVISDFHKSAVGFDGYIRKSLSNNTGKILEDYKVNIKRLKRDLKKINYNGPKNSFEEYLSTRGNQYVKRSKKCIEHINECNYLGIVLRSMKRVEICIGNTRFDNLRGREKIEIVSIEDCAYNLVELDCFTFLNRLKKRGLNFDWFNLVDKFCEFENLDSNSKGMILALLSYPDEFMKCCNRYREDKKKWSPEKYKLRLEKAIKQDGNSLI